MSKSKSDARPGNVIHIYHMFGYAEYRDAEGTITYINDSQIYGTWGSDPLLYTDDWEVIA